MKRAIVLIWPTEATIDCNRDAAQIHSVTQRVYDAATGERFIAECKLLHETCPGIRIWEEFS